MKRREKERTRRIQEEQEMNDDERIGNALRKRV